MQVQKLFADEDAVSPVIGVILMVAITVILAAVIGTFVLGLGDQVQNTAPQASFTFDFNSTDVSSTGELAQSTAGSGNLTVAHDGGDKLKQNEVNLSDDSGNSVKWGSSGDITAGTTKTVQVDDNDKVRVIWNPGSDNSATLGKWTGPEA